MADPVLILDPPNIVSQQDTQGRIMSSNALYYPYIQVPESPWFTRVLLYWDRVGAIVPNDYIEDPDRLGSYMVSLVRENLVEQVIPGMHLWRVSNFANAFLEYTDAKYGSFGEPYISDWAAVHAGNLGGSSIHMEKLHDLGAKLCERGMARRDDNDEYSPWFKIEPRIADDFMAYLAGVLGQMPGDARFSPITNRRTNLDPYVPELPPPDPKYDVRLVLLENILPAPAGSLEAAQLRDFKQQYEEPLRRFRKEVEEEISELASIGDAKLQKMRLEDVTASLRETINEVTARMGEKNWPQLNFGTLCTVVGSGMTAWKAVLDQDWRFGVTGAALSLAPAVYSAFRGSDVSVCDEPLAYAALAGKHLQ